MMKNDKTQLAFRALVMIALCAACARKMNEGSAVVSAPTSVETERVLRWTIDGRSATPVVCDTAYGPGAGVRALIGGESLGEAPCTNGALPVLAAGSALWVIELFAADGRVLQSLRLAVGPDADPVAAFDSHSVAIPTVAAPSQPAGDGTGAAPAPTGGSGSLSVVYTLSVRVDGAVYVHTDYSSMDSEHSISCDGKELLDCTRDFDAGTVVTLYATPAASNAAPHFVGCDADATTVCTVTMNANKSVFALAAP